MEILKSKGCNRLVIDLRGCLGGSLGFANLVSYLCADRIPIGYDVTTFTVLRFFRVLIEGNQARYQMNFSDPSRREDKPASRTSQAEQFCGTPRTHANECHASRVSG